MIEETHALVIRNN